MLINKIITLIATSLNCCVVNIIFYPYYIYLFISFLFNNLFSRKRDGYISQVLFHQSYVHVLISRMDIFNQYHSIFSESFADIYVRVVVSFEFMTVILFPQKYSRHSMLFPLLLFQLISDIQCYLK